MGAEIWVKIGPTPPVDPGELTFLAVDTRTPYTTNCRVERIFLTRFPPSTRSAHEL